MCKSRLSRFFSVENTGILLFLVTLHGQIPVFLGVSDIKIDVILTFACQG